MGVELYEEEAFCDVVRAGDLLADIVRAVLEVKGDDWPHCCGEFSARLEAWETAKRDAGVVPPSPRTAPLDTRCVGHVAHDASDPGWQCTRFGVDTTLDDDGQWRCEAHREQRRASVQTSRTVAGHTGGKVR